MVSSTNEKLIFLVQQYPCLYDPSDKDYKSFEKKQHIWDKIAKEIQHNHEVTRVKWKNLKDGYTKYKKQTSGLSQKKSYANWIWGPSLQFLDNVKKVRRGTATNDDDYSLTEDVLNSPRRSSTSDNAHVSAFLEEESQDASGQVSSPQRSRKRSHDMMEYLNNLKRNDRDAIDHLFASYAETFKKLKPRTQAVVKVKLAKLFAEAEIKDFDSRADPLMFYNDNESESAVRIKEEGLM